LFIGSAALLLIDSLSDCAALAFISIAALLLKCCGALLILNSIALLLCHNLTNFLVDSAAFVFIGCFALLFIDGVGNSFAFSLLTSTANLLKPD